MLANWVKQGTSTVGTGAITLDGTPPAGYVAFKDVFADGQSVYYVIDDGNNREVGYGTLAAGVNWTLSRDLIYETLEGGIYTRFPASGINLSGSASVTIDASAQTLIASPLLNRAAAATSRADVRVTHLWASRNNASTLTLSANTLYAWPCFIATPGKVNAFVARVNAAATSGTKFRCGLYCVGTGWRQVGRLLAESPDFSSATTGTQVASLASPIFINPGWYWLAIASDGDPRLETFDAAETPGGHGLVGHGGYPKLLYDRWYQSLTAGWTNLPANPPAFTVSTGGAGYPMVLLDVT